MNKGTLFIVATPIGNLSDITLRAIETLKSVDLILSEDTRETDKILKKYEISKPQLSYRDQNHNTMLPKVVSMLNSSSSIALISDSGTPLISDPGYKLIRDLIQKDFNVISIPGPSAVISSIVSSGFPTDKFSFVGFLPKSSGDRKKVLKSYGDLDSTLIIYESPFRIIKLLKEIKEVLGDRFVCLANEMTKIHEKFIRNSVSLVLKDLEGKKLKGEFVVLIGKKGFKL
ncbi:MAG: 16S rRNA (cytidine(1402)-2'-O)-methyltransferase [Patescibacteria group bacterium]